MTTITTTTLTLEQQQPQRNLTLRMNRKKKNVTWKEGTVDNEFLQRKTSKNCWIFHKDKPFDEDDSDDHGRSKKSHDHDHDHGDGCCSDSNGGDWYRNVESEELCDYVW